MRPDVSHIGLHWQRRLVQATAVRRSHSSCTIYGGIVIIIDSDVTVQQCDALCDGRAAGGHYATHCATCVIANGNISLDPRLHIFTVAGTMDPRVVRLFPATSCSCPASSQCYHVLTAKMAIGLQDNGEPTWRINLTQLRHNKRKRADKTSGRKRPRQNDVDVIAAGDADPEVVQQLAAAVTQSTTSVTATATAAALYKTLCVTTCACDATNWRPPGTVLHDEGGSLRGSSASYAKCGITPIASAWATTHRRHLFAMFVHNSYSINIFDYCTDYGE